MLLSQNQILELLKIIEQNTNIFITQSLGQEYLTTDEKEKLKKVGINSDKLYTTDSDLATQSYHFGLISDSLGKIDSQKITFNDLKNYFKKGQHIPLTKIERYALDSIKGQSLKDIKANKNRIFADINNVLSVAEKNQRIAYENVIRGEVEKGLIDHKTTGEIARELGRITGDWNRNFRKSIEFISHTALSEGKIAAIERKGGKKIYMTVYNGACKHCIKFYLTKGLGSQPRVFDIEEIKQHGNNIGRKVDKWEAVIPPNHVFCRCHVVEYIEGTTWNDKTKRFELTKFISKKVRKPIKFSIEINGKVNEYQI